MAGENHGGADHGPSWWDVERAILELETRHDCAVAVTLIPNKEPGRGVVGWVVYARAHAPKKLHEKPLASGVGALRGNRGSRTLPSALVMALLELSERLEVEGGQAKFPGF